MEVTENIMKNKLKRHSYSLYHLDLIALRRKNNGSIKRSLICSLGTFTEKEEANSVASILNEAKDTETFLAIIDDLCLTFEPGSSFNRSKYEVIIKEQRMFPKLLTMRPKLKTEELVDATKVESYAIEFLGKRVDGSVITNILGVVLNKNIASHIRDDVLELLELHDISQVNWRLAEYGLNGINDIFPYKSWTLVIHTAPIFSYKTENKMINQRKHTLNDMVMENLDSKAFVEEDFINDHTDSEDIYIDNKRIKTVNKVVILASVVSLVLALLSLKKKK